MAGHSKFKNIMYKKGAQDAKRAKVFTKLAREITVATKIGGPEPDSNPRLRLAIQNARADNMPKDNIERAIKKAIGGDTESYDEIRYEGFGPGGVGIIVEALTDNRNRTASEVRSYFAKMGGNLGETGSVSFMFQQLGRITYNLGAASADDMLEAAIEAGADECETSDDEHEILCDPGSLGSVRDALETSFGEAASVRIIWRPATTVEIEEETGSSILKLIDLLEDNDDVQMVYANFEMSDETLERLAI